MEYYIKKKQTKLTEGNLNGSSRFILPLVRTNFSCYQSMEDKKKKTKVNLPYLLKSIYDSTDISESQQHLNKSVESINQLINRSPPHLSKDNHKYQKIKSRNSEDSLSLDEAQQIVHNNIKQPEERAVAARVIAQASLKKVFHGQLPNIEAQGLKKHTRRNKNKLNTKILTQILGQIQHNSRSHSIVIRKSELDQIQAEFGFGKGKDKGKIIQKSKFIVQKKSDSENGRAFDSEEQRLEIIYNLKNDYPPLKDFIITSKCEEYQLFSKQFQEPLQKSKMTGRAPNFKKTFILTSIDKQNKSSKHLKQFQRSYCQFQPQQKTKPIKTIPNIPRNPKSKFELTTQRLIIEHMTDIHPSAWLFMMKQCRFQQLKTIKIKYVNIPSELIYFMLDCMKEVASSGNKMEVFQCTNVKIQNMTKFGQKLANFLAFVPVRLIKLQSLELTDRQLYKVCSSLQTSKICTQLSFRSNKIDILSVRHVEQLCKKLPTLEQVDLRFNEIPHYANLRDKNPIIQFF